MTYECRECDVHWHAYQATNGVCPECGGGTRYSSEPATEGSADRHRAALRLRAEEDASFSRHDAFEAYYLEREMRLNGLDSLSVREAA